MLNRHKILGLISILPMMVFNTGCAFAEAVKNAESILPGVTEVQLLTHFAQPKMTDEQLKNAILAVEKLAQKQVDNKIVPGLAIAIVHNDSVVFAKGFGLRESTKSEFINADTVFQLASVSKSVASTVVAALVGEGKLSWNSKICDLDPGFQMNDPWITSRVTVADLFAHRSGLPDHSGDLLEDIGYDRGQVLHRLRHQELDGDFRLSYAYTNFGLTEAACAAAKTGGLAWEQTCEEKLYRPLSMNSTSSRYADFIARANRAPGHVLVDGKWLPKYQRDPDSQSPAGGVSSSVNDMANWMRLQLADGKFEGKQIVAKDAIAETHHPQIFTKFSEVDGLPQFYGLGFNVSYDDLGRLRLGHSGAFSRGVATNITLVPAENLGICVLTNAYPIGVAEGVALTFTDLALYGKTTQDWLPLFKMVFSNPATFGVSTTNKYDHVSASSTQALANRAYVGRYKNEFFGELEIVEKDGRLELVLGPKKMNFALKHFDRDIFTYAADTENLSGASGVLFNIGDENRSKSVLVENLNPDGQGLFTRMKDTH